MEHDDQNEDPQRISAKERAKERAKLYRKQVYERAKEANRARRLEMKNSPAATQRKARRKEKRREEYAKAKELYKEKEAKKKEQARQEEAEHRAGRDAALMSLLVPAHKLEPSTKSKKKAAASALETPTEQAPREPTRPRLRLVKPDEPLPTPNTDDMPF